ncbi:MAG: pyridine nucleotide transhydrogenase [Deltaproteobacteria bacterium]|nr:pyridine nucleotide transhydrogenase [Deltaproteobacteria bacterium]
MDKALIGHTGFVGGNLARQAAFEATYNSKNIEELRGRRFGEIWCAGVVAAKWWANQHPEEDLAGIDRLLDCLAQVEAKRFVLISTVDVYLDPQGVDEATPLDTAGLHAYGRHRLEVERFVASHFPQHHIIRLPGLFGRGLKKNIIYDFLHENQLENIHAGGVFQFYGLHDLKRDLDQVVGAGIPLMNFATEPVSVREVAQKAFGRDFTHDTGRPPARYDMHTRHAAVLGGAGNYIWDRDKVLAEIAAYVKDARPAPVPGPHDRQG